LHGRRKKADALLYSYRELSDAEIGRYLDFAESRSGRKYHAVVNGLHNALAAAAHFLADQLDQNADKNA